MTAAVAALAGAVAVLSFGLWSVVRSATAERAQWAAERRSLVDRVIARHTGEVVALDRQAVVKQVVKQGPLDTPVAVGL